MTSGAPDLYAILGLTSEATQEEILRAYRALLREHHPDTRATAHAAESDARLGDVLAAYRVLGDPVRRADYDTRTQPRIRHHRPRRPAAPGRPPIVAGPVLWQPPPGRS